MQEKCAGKKMTTAEWGKQLLLRYHFYLVLGNRWSILAAHREGEAAGCLAVHVLAPHALRPSTTHGN
jgi:hypothetical protein